MTDRVSASPLVLEDGVVWPEDAIEVGRIVDAFGYGAVFWVMGFLHLIAMTIVLTLVKKRA